MKTNLKALELIEKGLSPKTVSKLTESQINTLHSKLISEQAPTQSGVETRRVVKDVTKVTDAALSNPSGAQVNMSGAKKVKKVPGGVEISDGYDLEESKKDDKNNPWAICHKQLGPKRNAKFESCVKQVKKSLKEGKNPVSLFIENKIMQLVETHLPPRITKQDLVQYLSEQNPATAPVKDPKTKPGTKEPPSPVKTPSHPGKNPNPKVNPSPKATSVDPEEAKDKIIDTIMQILKK